MLLMLHRLSNAKVKKKDFLIEIINGTQMKKINPVQNYWPH